MKLEAYYEMDGRSLANYSIAKYNRNGQAEGGYHCGLSKNLLSHLGQSLGQFQAGEQ